MATHDFFFIIISILLVAAAKDGVVASWVGETKGGSTRRHKENHC